MKRRSKFRLTAMLCFALIIVFTTACSSNKSSKESASPAGSTATPAAGSAAPVQSAAIDPLGKYDTPITISAVRIAATTLKYENGDTMENNAWTKVYEGQLGIKLKYDWLVPDPATYDQKLNVTIASGSLPDIMTVNQVQFKELNNAGLLADLSEALDKYGSPLTKAGLNKDGGVALKSATINGKLMGIPAVNYPADAAQVLYVRSDWLKKVNLPEPKTMQDVFAISEADC